MHQPDRLRLATRIHFALRRHHGLDIEVERLLDGGRESREALWVCEASDDEELRQLAGEMRRAEQLLAAARAARKAQTEQAARAAAAAPAPQDAAWSRNTSGFGLSGLMGLDGAAAGEAGGRSWRKPSTWLKRDGGEPQP